jgi:hypothetical protein
MGKDPDKTIQINPSDLNRHSYTGQLIYIVIAYTTKANNPYRKYIIPIFNNLRRKGINAKPIPSLITDHS